MREHLLVLFLTAALTYIFTPLAEKAALRFGAIAYVRNRDVHTTPTPRWGGVAIWCGIALSIGIANQLPLLHKAFIQSEQIRGILLASAIVLFLGMADDRWGVDAITKLAGQSVAAGVLLLNGVQLLWLPVNGVTTLPTAFGQLLTILVILISINAVNFIDGLDGLAAGIVAIAAVAFFSYAYLLSVVYNFDRAGAPSLITAIVVGSCIGFLPHNFYPARIFMGDSGSMVLGLLLGVSAITLTGQLDANAISSQKLTPVFFPLLLPFSVLAIPLIDLILAIARRIKAGKSPFAPDKQHLHHQILKLGHSQRSATILLYFWTASIALPVSASAFIDWRVNILITFLIFLPTLLFTLKPKLMFTIISKRFRKQENIL